MINKPTEKNGKKVIVAMSGGVDSSVAAALLKDQGYEVIGVFFQFWKEKNGKLADGLKSAKNIADILHIPLEVIDLSKEFRKKVIDYTLREFQSGRTPNPCCQCNPKIKFEALSRLAEKYQAYNISTGHYAILKKFKVQSSKCKIKGDVLYKLFESRDKTKDQSYFIYGLKQKQLAKIIFPLGNYRKTEVKEMARKMELPVYDRKESHDVCFVPGKLDAYLRKKLSLKKGNIVNADGQVLGKHQGLPLYTIGQRKGIELGGAGPFYVTEKNNRNNEITVTGKSDSPELFRKSMKVKDLNWLGKMPKFPLKTLIRIRYGHPSVRGIIRMAKNLPSSVAVEFEKKQRAVTPGQSAVFYGKRGEVLGGGIIS